MTDADLAAERTRVEALPIDDPKREPRMLGVLLLESMTEDRRRKLFVRTEHTFETMFGRAVGAASP